MFNNPGKLLNRGVCAPKGFQANAIACGIKDPLNPRLDMGLVFSTSNTVSTGVFTTNSIKAATVKVCQNHLTKANTRAFFVNSGNANACTGTKGVEDATQCAKVMAHALDLNKEEIGICSTGVIGLPLPIERMAQSIPKLADDLQSSETHEDLFSCSIMTSDTRKKEIAIEVEVEGETFRIGACAKGAGMIRPNMATMLCFITTDLRVSSKEVLHEHLIDATNNTFNRISIDGDMSTNDTVLIMANGQSMISLDGDKNSQAHRLFKQALLFVMDQLAQQIVLDGEKVSKFVTLKVKNAHTNQDAQKIAEAVSNSPLVKSSWNGNDPNWGRVIHAVGYACSNLKEELINISWEDHLACEKGMLGPASIEDLRKVASQDSFELIIDLNLGEGCYTMYTSDLSPEYVDYNRSEYCYWDALAKSKK